MLSKSESSYLESSALLQQSGQIDDLMYNQFEVPGRKDLPPQDRWSYHLRHYIQYLVDLQATHHILESGIAEALAVHQGRQQSLLSHRF